MTEAALTDDDLREAIRNWPDLFKSTGLGAGQGAINVVGMPGDLQRLALNASGKLLERWGMEPHRVQAAREALGARAEKTGTPVLARLQDDLLKKLEEFRRQEPDMPSRAEGIRRLVA